jgi:hypothetical protein
MKSLPGGGHGKDLGIGISDFGRTCRYVSWRAGVGHRPVGSSPRLVCLAALSRHDLIIRAMLTPAIQNRPRFRFGTWVFSRHPIHRGAQSCEFSVQSRSRRSSSSLFDDVPSRGGQRSPDADVSGKAPEWRQGAVPRRAQTGSTSGLQPDSNAGLNVQIGKQPSISAFGRRHLRTQVARRGSQT